MAGKGLTNKTECDFTASSYPEIQILSKLSYVSNAAFWYSSPCPLSNGTQCSTFYINRSHMEIVVVITRQIICKHYI